MDGVLTTAFDMSQPAISKHLRVLERRDSSSKAGRHSGGHVGCWPDRCGTSPIGSASTDGTGRRASIGWTRGSTDTTTIYSEGGDLVYERTFDAPREMVWKAHTDPQLIGRWWGPHGTTTKVGEMDLGPGGKWRYVSSAPDRDDIEFYGEYLEIVPPERIRWTFMFDVEGVGPQGGPETLTLDDAGGKTLMRAISHMGSAEVIDAALATGMTQGAIETWDRLAGRQRLNGGRGLRSRRTGPSRPS